MTLLLRWLAGLKRRWGKAKQQGRIFFAQLLHDNLKAAIWQRALLRNIFRGVFFSVRFFLQCLHFNMRMRYRDRMRKAKAAGGKEKPDSMLRVCNFCMQLFFFRQCSCILRWIILELNSSILDDFYVSAVWEPSVGALNMLLQPANKRC